MSEELVAQVGHLQDRVVDLESDIGRLIRQRDRLLGACHAIAYIADGDTRAFDNALGIVRQAISDVEKWAGDEVMKD